MTSHPPTHTHTSCPKLAVDTHKNTSPPSKLTPFSTKVTDLFQLLAQKNCTTWLKRHPQLTICTLPLAPPSSCKTVKTDTAGHSSQHKSHTSFYLENPTFTCQVGLASDWPPRCQTQLDKPTPPNTHTSCPKLAVDTHKNTSPPPKLTLLFFFQQKSQTSFQRLTPQNCTTWFRDTHN